MQNDSERLVEAGAQPRKDTGGASWRISTHSSTSISKSFVEQFAKASRSRSQSPEGDSNTQSPVVQSISLEQFNAGEDTLAEEASPRKHAGSCLATLHPDSDTSFGMDDSLLGGPFEFVSYQEVDINQRAEFEALLKKVPDPCPAFSSLAVQKSWESFVAYSTESRELFCTASDRKLGGDLGESSWARSCLHKGLVVNLFFFVVMVVGIVLAEVFFPLEGVRGGNDAILNDTSCLNDTPACFTVRIIRGVGVFGFLGGITNWIAIEMLFTRIPFLIGTGIIAKQHKEIRESIRQLVVDTLFDPVALKQYFSGRKKSIREMLHLETHFGSLLNSNAANQIIDRKIDAALARPEGFVLVMMGADHRELKSIMKRHIQNFIADISPAVLDRMATPGITDGVELQAEVERILEERLEDLSANKVKRLVAVMIRKHLSWLIVWGNLFGALLGLIAEIIALVVGVTKV